MKITIDRLKEIIKEEIEASDQPDKLSGFTKSATQRSRTAVDREQVSKGLEILADEIARQQSIEGKARIVALIMQKLGIDTADQAFLRMMTTVRTKSK